MSEPAATGGLDGPLTVAALEILRPLLLEPVLHHSLRTAALAAAEAKVRGWDVDPDDLLVAGLFHDSGTAADDSAERFEVTGADRAVAFARTIGRGEESCQAIWDAVALHTSPGIAERHRPLTRALRAGVLTDFGSPELSTRHRELRDELELRYPRDDIERVLAAAVVRAALTTPDKAPASSWPADLVRGAALMSEPEGDNPCF